MPARRLLRFGVVPMTVLFVAAIALLALMLDWLSYQWLHAPRADQWVLIDLVIASVIAAPVTYLLLKLLQRSHQQQKELATALAEVRELKGLLPLCAGCKKVRDDDGYWQQVETYIRKHTRAEITHSLCPTCVKVYCPELDNEP